MSERSAAPENHPMRLGLCAALILCLLCCVSQTTRAQQQRQWPSVPGLKGPAEDKSGTRQNLSLETRVARGLAPLGRLYENLRVESSKIYRLGKLSLPESYSLQDEKRERIGEVRSLARPLRSSGDATLYRLTEGRVRVMGLISAGALATRVHFSRMSLPAGARLFVYSVKNPDEYYGPFEGVGPSGDGEFWTPPLEGDEVAIEYFSPTGTEDSGADSFEVTAVSHIYADPFAENLAGSCNLEVTPEWADVAKSVGHLQFTSGTGEFLCTGTLLNDQAQDLTPYLLTANHCFDTQAEAQSLRVHWLYNTGESASPFPLTDGANLLATGPESDFTLVQLTGLLPAGLFYAGWDAGPLSVSTPVTGLHHPRGSHKRISFGTTVTGCSNALPGPCGNFTGINWSSGTTEGGSSGSGIWTGTPATARLVGSLWGGAASCSFLNGTDFYGRFSVTYPNIASFLAGGVLPPTIQLTESSYTVSEGIGALNVTVRRTGNLNLTSSVQYKTSDTAGLSNCNPAQSGQAGAASSRCDYSTAVGTLRFLPGEENKTITLIIVDDVYTEPSESFRLSLSGPTGATLGTYGSAQVTINGNSNDGTQQNPIDGNAFFITQHYIDFLGREPEANGLSGWLNRFQTCPRPGEQPQDCDRLAISSGIYLSPEFRDRGYFVYKLYAASLGRFPHYDEFMPELARVSGFLTADELTKRKLELIADFMTRTDFRAIYDSQSTARGFVETVLGKAGVSVAQKEELIGRLSAGTITRAEALKEIAESGEVDGKYVSEATVVMHYFGYLRRDPDSLYQHWIDELRQTGNYRTITNGFVNSQEYRSRFGP